MKFLHAENEVLIVEAEDADLEGAVLELRLNHLFLNASSNRQVNLDISVTI